MGIVKVLFFVIVNLIALDLNVYADDNVRPQEQIMLEKATFAGGCFWCMESEFEHLKGVKEAISGYMGGQSGSPTYDEVSSGRSGHKESIQVLYDPATVTYERLLEVFWQNIDPTDAQGQFADQGDQYTTAIFYQDEKQKELAEESKKNLELSGKFDKPIAVSILPAAQFYPAEEHHQDYYKKKPMQYKMYRIGSGREQFLDETWGKDRKK